MVTDWRTPTNSRSAQTTQEDSVSIIHKQIKHKPGGETEAQKGKKLAQAGSDRDGIFFFIMRGRGRRGLSHEAQAVLELAMFM